uniref:Uncharacterized protein n=1 Tax=Clandestinovirus TaxID=2831644 RepID=A0A8F8KUF7_9VIRU|nr:hypothetical protein KOM_12_545 [Clandestinovirus]
MFKVVTEQQKIAANFLVKNYAKFVETHKDHMSYIDIASVEPDGRTWVIGNILSQYLQEFNNDENIVQKDISRPIGIASVKHKGVECFTVPFKSVTWGEVLTDVEPKKESTMTWADLSKQLGPPHWPLDKDEEGYMKEWEDILNKDKDYFDPEMHGPEDDEFLRKNMAKSKPFSDLPIDLPNRPQNYFRSLPSFAKK